MAAETGYVLDGFDLYGSGDDSRDFLLSGQAYAELYSPADECNVPSWGPRTGAMCFRTALTTAAPGSGARRVLDAAYTQLMVSLAYSCESLPSGNGVVAPIEFRDAANNPVWSLVIQSTGALAIVDGAPQGTVRGTTAGPVMQAGVWQWIEIYANVAGGASDFIVYVDDEDTPVLNLTNVVITGAEMSQFAIARQRGGGSGIGGNVSYVDDLFIRKLAVADTPDFLGDTAVATLRPNADTTTAGWTPFPRKNLGVGILDSRAATNAGVTAAQSTDFNLGSGDFTLEGFVRFEELPAGADYTAIWGKWLETSNARSYQLLLCGPSLNDGQLVFRISTDGLAGSVVNLLEWPWSPLTDQWYFLTVERVAGETTLYIDGIRQGLTVADVNTYAVVSAPFAIHAQSSGTSSLLTATGLNGFGDELRVTVGDYRYDGDFTPPVVPFPTTLGGDPLFANVALLAQWDNGIVDSSLHGRALTARNGAVQNTPDDGAFAFQTINNDPPRDDTYIQAELTQATGELAFGNNPTNTQTVVLGTETYTFKTVLAVAYDVLIGADAEASILNLIAAVNNDAGEGTLYGTGTLPNDDAYMEKRPLAVADAYAILAGTAGNTIPSTTTVTGASWTAATLTGGVNIPGPSSFDIERLPYDATEVHAVAVVTRGYKTAAGTVKVQATFVGPQGGEETGTEYGLTTNPGFHTDVFIDDPDGGPLTPSTIASARIKVNRTE